MSIVAVVSVEPVIDAEVATTGTAATLGARANSVTTATIQQFYDYTASHVS